ncbi:hypothetical protein EDB81DRAFT_933919 [Dactylonectria macrodidyma]|uniref:Transmembrane protein 53 n=1 Tax=Dactylonectria macrodidyma TaxID=307937 RepID=A0A9P9EX10_9HYPO|nr:hypothetical protein EDB81DRAFT_933919 [Dactylonectria macrodidyma]
MGLSRTEDGPPPTLPTPFVPLGNNVFLFEPSVKPADARGNSSGSGCPPPSLIILCTWLGGATTPRIAKYVEGYQKAFPAATLILIRTVFADIAVRSFAAVRSRLEPARDAIIGALQPPAPGAARARALLHIFSHGGCNTAIQLAHTVSDAAGTLLCDHLRQIIFDCCPGDTSFDKAFNAAAVSLPPGAPEPFRAVGMAAVFAAVATISVLQKTGLMSSVSDMRRQLNEPALLGSAARRLYLFSRADRMVAPASVQSHAQLAREAGYDVGLVLFREAPHCALVTDDASKYWHAIQDCWMGGSLPQLDDQSQLRHGLLKSPIRLPSRYRDSRGCFLHLLARNTVTQLLCGHEVDPAPVRRASALDEPRLPRRYLPPAAFLRRSEAPCRGSGHLSRLADSSCPRASTIQGTRRRRRRRRFGRTGAALAVAPVVSCRSPRCGFWRR